MKALTCVALTVLSCVPVLAARGDDRANATKPVDAKKPAIYDDKADAQALIDAGLAVAKRQNRRVLIQWGGNWCSWCVLLHDRFKNDSDLAKTLRNEYALVYVDSNSNTKLAAKYSADLKSNGVPYLTILDADDKVLVNQSTVPFETKVDGQNGHDSKRILDFLNKYRATPLKAEEELASVLAKAASSNRRVFLHCSAPWCGWCVRLENWLARPEIASVFGKDFVELKIDIDRMQGGKEVHARYNKGEKGGIPWFVILDAKGKALITSDGPEGNIGYPGTDAEIAHFVTMLNACKQRMTHQDIDGLRASLLSLMPKTTLRTGEKH
jgi:thioredoxin-related protein